MRVVLDVSPLSRPRTGIGNYLRGLVGALATQDETEVVAFGLASPRGKRNIETSLAALPVERRLRVVPGAHAWRTAWSRAGRVAVERLAGDLDVFHFSDWMYPPQRSGLRATTIYDLIPLRFQDWVTPRTRAMHTAKYRHAARTCDLIVCISRSTAADVTEHLGVGAERLAVAHPGLDPRFGPDGRRPERAEPYVLAVSTREPRKNLAVATEAFRLLRERRPELTLLVAGAAGHGEEAVSGDGVELLGFVPDDQLAALYRGAAAFVYPSRFEGFGMPVIEALASGTPVVASSHPSLDEACGDAALRADPDDTGRFADLLDRAVEEREALAPRGLAHARRFTWEATGRAVADAYRRAREST
ncbi:MAG: glycosyltransferase family 4 protein [Gaiellaceae bacterium]